MPVKGLDGSAPCHIIRSDVELELELDPTPLASHHAHYTHTLYRPTCRKLLERQL